MSNVYDAIIVGAGLSGLSLACELGQLLPNFRILLIDKRQDWGESHTWSFWTDCSTNIESVVSHTWKKLEIVTSNRTVHQLDRYRFQLVEGTTLYSHFKRTLSHCANVSFKLGEVTKIIDSSNIVSVELSTGEKLQSKIAFDSRYFSELVDSEVSISGYGYQVTTKEASFNPKVITFYDSRLSDTPQSVRFAYIMPFTPKKALVDITCFGQSVSRKQAQGLLEQYLGTVLKLDNYAYREVEGGKPTRLSDELRTRYPSQHVIKIGLAAGMMMPTSGFALKNILDDSRNLALTLAQGKSFKTETLITSKVIKIFEKGLLWLIKHRPYLVKKMFDVFFSKMPVEKILAMLDNNLVLKDVPLVLNSIKPKDLIAILKS